jgi:hypothetical protein
MTRPIDKLDKIESAAAEPADFSGHGPNRHPIDELADVRAEIKRLEAREAALRRRVIQSGDMAGDEFEGVLKRTIQERVDVPAAKRELGAVLRPFLRERACEQLWLKRRA